MGVIEDIRKVIQNFDQRLKGIEQSHVEIKAELKDFRSEMLRMFEKADQRNEIRYKELVTAMNLEAHLKRIEESH